MSETKDTTDDTVRTGAAATGTAAAASAGAAARKQIGRAHV